MKICEVIIILLTVILIGIIFSGCAEVKISAADDINRSVSLMNSGAARIEKIDLEAGAYSDAKAKFAASKVDYEEALKILNNATTNYDNEKEEIELNKKICSYSLDYIVASQHYVTFLEHYDKSLAYIESEDITLAKSELKLAEDALNRTIPLISTAKEKCLSINIDTLSSESKSNLLEDRIIIEQNEKVAIEFREMSPGMHYLLDGYEYVLNAINYIDNEEWNSAAIEINKSSIEFSKSKNIFANFTDSEFTEVSIAAIEINGLLKEMLDDLPHLEAGCIYASKNNYYKAYEEFNKVV